MEGGTGVLTDGGGIGVPRRCSPTVLVVKKDGSIQFCVDYCKVNEVPWFNAYPMPRVNKLLDCLGIPKFFTSLDLT